MSKTCFGRFSNTAQCTCLQISQQCQLLFGKYLQNRSIVSKKSQRTIRIYTFLHIKRKLHVKQMLNMFKRQSSDLIVVFDKEKEISWKKCVEEV